MPTDPNDVRTNDLEKWLYPAAGAMHEWRGSYLGFTYNGKHSSEFGIVRTSTSNRYDDNLLPNKNVKTTAVPGGDGAYYFGSNYTQRQFTVQFAFDALSDAQLREMRQWLGTGQIHDLIFDEFPYKVYSAAVTGNATAKHLCFDEGNGVVYKGDGSIQFTCYFPFARSRYKWLSDYTIANIPEWGNDEFYNNTSEWAEGSQLWQSSTKQYPSSSARTVPIDVFQIALSDCAELDVLNNGDMPVDFLLYISQNALDNMQNSSIQIYYNHSGVALQCGQLPQGVNLVIDTKAHLIRGWDLVNNQKVMNDTIYNNYIIAGDFFQLEKGLTHLSLDLDQGGSSYVESSDFEIKYDYLYY